MINSLATVRGASEFAFAFAFTAVPLSLSVAPKARMRNAAFGQLDLLNRSPVADKEKGEISQLRLANCN